MSFHSVTWLLLVLLSPVLIFVYVFQTRNRERKIKKYLRLSGQSSSDSRKRIGKFALLILAFVLLVFSMARPQGSGKLQQGQQRGIYILLLLDISASMRAEDVKPNRLTFMKREISRLTALSSGDQIALAFFAGGAVLISPFTHDNSLIRSFLNDLSLSDLTAQGTNFERAIQFSRIAFKRMKAAPKGAKALVIASDGGDHSEKAERAAAELLETENVRIFSLSFGTKKGGLIPLRDQKGQIKEYKRDSSGKPVVTNLKEDLLKRLAQLGKGTYYHTAYGTNTAERLREDLDRLDKSFFKESAYLEKKEYYQYFLLLAICLILLEMFLSDRVFTKKEAKQRTKPQEEITGKITEKRVDK